MAAIMTSEGSSDIGYFLRSHQGSQLRMTSAWVVRIQPELSSIGDQAANSLIQVKRK
jgi:hypothetical protein